MQQPSLIFHVERDTTAYVFFVGEEPTQEGIKKLIQNLTLSLDTYPEKASAPLIEGGAPAKAIGETTTDSIAQSTAEV
jgi:hypothetical protein